MRHFLSRPRTLFPGPHGATSRVRSIVAAVTPNQRADRGVVGHLSVVTTFSSLFSSPSRVEPAFRRLHASARRHAR